MAVDPGTAAIISAGIQAAPSLLGLFGGGGGKDDELAQQAAQYQQEFAWRHKQATRGIHWKVKDARRAGLHPLFALGASQGYSPISWIPGQSVGGSHAGDAIQGVADAAAQGLRGYAAANAPPSDVEELQKKLLEAQIRNVDAETMLTNSRVKTQTAAALSSAAGTPADMGRGFHGTPLRSRRLVNEPNVSLPSSVELIMEDGSRRRIVNPAAGEELSQISYIWEAMKDGLLDLFNTRARTKKRGAMTRRR